MGYFVVDIFANFADTGMLYPRKCFVHRLSACMAMAKRAIRQNIQAQSNLRSDNVYVNERVLHWIATSTLSLLTNVYVNERVFHWIATSTVSLLTNVYVNERVLHWIATSTVSLLTNVYVNERVLHWIATSTVSLLTNVFPYSR